MMVRVDMFIPCNSKYILIATKIRINVRILREDSKEYSGLTIILLHRTGSLVPKLSPCTHKKEVEVIETGRGLGKRLKEWVCFEHATN